MSANNYPVAFSWEAHTYGTTSAVGDPSDVWADPVTVWGGYAADRSGATVTVLDSDQASYAATIRLRNYPAVNPLDALTDPQSGEVWYVDSVRRGANELIAEVSR